MRIKIILCLLLGFNLSMAYAAEVSFVVYYAKGNVTKTGSSVRLKKGDQVSRTETLLVAAQSTIILVCSNYKVIKLESKGTYGPAALQARCSAGTPGYSSSYFKYVWNEFSHTHSSPDAHPEAYMKNVGAVSRGCHDVQTAMHVDTLHLTKQHLPLVWTSSLVKPFLAVFDREVDGAPLMKFHLTQNIAFDLSELTAMLDPGEYYWQVMDSAGNGCERNYLKIWNEADYKAHVADLLKGVPVTSAAETFFVRAYILQENHFMAEALKYYKQAVRVEPSNKLYRASLKQLYEIEN